MRKKINRKGTNRRFVVYSLSFKGYIFYIGKTCQKLEDRFREHLTSNRRLTNLYKNNLRDIVMEEIEEYPDDNSALAGEIFWMQMFKFWGFKLINQVPCGHRYIPKKYASVKLC